MKNKEKRIRERVDYQIGAEFSSPDCKTIKAKIKNVSMSGMLMITDETIPEGIDGNVRIELEFGENNLYVYASCKVIRQEKSGIAIQLTNIDPQSSITLYNMIRYQTPTVKEN